MTECEEKEGEGERREEGRKERGERREERGERGERGERREGRGERGRKFTYHYYASTITLLHFQACYPLSPCFVAR